ncbi:MAG: ABC transporter permease [Bacteroidota bacterium]
MLFLKLFKESLLLALNALIVNKLRTFLSLLGITIGIFAIISVFTVVDSLELNIRNSIASLGDDVIFVSKWPWGGGGQKEYAWWKYMNRPIPQIQELAEIQRRCNTAQSCAFFISLTKTVKFQNNSVENVSIVAASHDYNKIISFELKKGRYFSEGESNSGKNIAVIGDAIAVNLFGRLNPIGRSIKVWGRKFNVIGIFKKEGESIVGNSHDNQVLIPINSGRGMIDIHGRHLDSQIMIKTKEGVSNEELKDELRGIMRSIRKLKPLADDNFALNETSIISSNLDNLFGVIGIAGWMIGGFSILVGGFGISNIMFVSVKERTSIIGIQKALRAKNYFILFQFLFEAVILCLIGGIIGLVLIFAGTIIANNFIVMEFALTMSNIILGLTVSAIIGVISGFVPAFSAARLDPVVAIRAA